MLITSKSYRFCLNHTRSPTYYNLAYHLKKQNWNSTNFAWRAHFGERHFQFDLNCTQTLEFKHLLAQLVAQYCPQVMPVTYCINDSNWPLIIEQISIKNIQNIIWILKPALLNNGQHIKIFQNLHQIKNHYLNLHRLGGEHVLQQYITNAHLLQGPKSGHKYSIRMFVVLTNYAGAYLYPAGYFNIALEPYQRADFTDLRSHLTNEHLLESQINVVQIPTQQYELFNPLYPKIKNIITMVMNGLRKQHGQIFDQKQRKLAIFGFDFMVDSDQKVWLLEANHAPCFPIECEHPLQTTLYDAFWQAVIASFVSPIVSNQSINAVVPSVFESCSTN